MRFRAKPLVMASLLAVLVATMSACRQTPKTKPAHSTTTDHSHTAKTSVPTHPRKAPSRPQPARFHIYAGVRWIEGNIQSAKRMAQKNHRPILLFWHAKWCPPCSALQMHVFGRPPFHTMASKLNLVWLDGDSAQAQRIAERLKISGYPTLVWLSPKGDEITRTVGDMSFQAFSQIFHQVQTGGPSFDELIKRTQSGTATSREWLVVADYGWDQPRDLTPQRTVVLLVSLVQKTPKSAPIALAKLTGHLLSAVATLPVSSPPTHKKIPKTSKRGTATPSVPDGVTNALQWVHRHGTGLVAIMLANPKSAWAAKNAILYSSEEILTWMRCSAMPGALRHRMIRSWTRAASWIAAYPDADLPDRLWAQYATIAVLTACRLPVPRKLRETATRMARRALTISKTSEERHAIVSSAAYLLSKTAGIEAAAHVLEREAKKTTTPWYYQADLANLYQHAHRPKQALTWSRLSVLSARGPATRLQWLAAHIRLEMAVSPRQQAEAIAKDIGELARQLVTSHDGLQGRNWQRTGRVLTRLDRWIRALCPVRAARRRGRKNEPAQTSFSENDRAALSQRIADQAQAVQSRCGDLTDIEAKRCRLLTKALHHAAVALQDTTTCTHP
ncbi:MAG: thioredoxin family protein [Deltaproteobacteria bacterium]|nr:thioredoxin family protein [Deltaproteobacteria bacterium]